MINNNIVNLSSFIQCDKNDINTEKNKEELHYILYL